MKKWLLGAVALVLAGPAAGQVVKTETATTYTFVNTDCDPNGRTTIMFNNAIGVAATLPRAGTNGQFLSGCQIKVQNIGAGPVVITPTTSTINSGTNYTVVSGASATIVPDAPPTTTGNYFAATGAVPPNANGRQALATMPAYFTMADYGAAIRPAKRRPAQVTIADASANLQIETTYSITASRLQCTSGSTTVTLTPGVFPNSANANNTKRIRLPGCGAAFADLNADVTSITTEGTTQTIVIGTAAGTPDDGTFYRPSLSDTFAWGIDDTIGRWGGGAFNHPSTLGDQIVVPAVLGRQNLNATPAPVSSAVNTPVNGFTYTTPDQQTFTAFTPAGTLATGAVVLPRNVPQSSRIQYMTTEELTALTVTAPSGYTISGTACAPCTVAANGSIAYTLSGTVFYRVQ